MNFLSQLKQRNQLLYWFGWYNIIVGLVCIALMPLDEATILGVSRWLKPMKFFLSVGLMVWTMNWLLYYLDNIKKNKRYSWLIVFSMFFENGIILLQAVRGTTSHFNVKTLLDGMLFNLMGIFILLFTITAIFIALSFFKQKQFPISVAYVWGIRLGLLFFIFFSVEGGAMLAILKHTVGATDGGGGLPVLNWSKQHGDLRIAHFFGIHSLQVLPLLGFYVAKSKKQIVVISVIYFTLVMLLLIQALLGIPLLF